MKPINNKSVSQSRVTSATISSSAKCKTDSYHNQQYNHQQQCNNGIPIMTQTTNLTRSRSLRLPTKVRDHHQYTMSSNVMQNSLHLSPNESLFRRNSSLRLSRSSAVSSHHLSPNNDNQLQSLIPSPSNISNVTVRQKQPKSSVMALKEVFGFGKKNNAKDKGYDNASKVMTVSMTSYGSDHNNDRSPHECQSPVSNCSIDSGVIGTNQNSAQSYLSHLRRLTEEHERLQMEYSRLSHQLIELKSLQQLSCGTTMDDENNCLENNVNVEHELNHQRSLAKNYKEEVSRLQEELRKAQRKYLDNIINGHASQESSTVDGDGSDGIVKLQQKSVSNEHLETIKNLESKVRELETETKEEKENIEFLTSERCIIAETLKETEEMFHKEKMEWEKERNDMREQIIVLSDNVQHLTLSLSEKDDILEKLGAKYTRNRKVWEENDIKATMEIKKLDEIIDNVIETLRSLPELSTSKTLRHLLVSLTGEVSDNDD